MADMMLEEYESEIINRYRSAKTKKVEVERIAWDYVVKKEDVIEFLFERGELTKQQVGAYNRHAEPDHKLTREEFEAKKAKLRAERGLPEKLEPIVEPTTGKSDNSFEPTEEPKPEPTTEIVIKKVASAPPEVIALVTNKLAEMEDDYRKASAIVHKYEKLARYLEQVAVEGGT